MLESSVKFGVVGKKRSKMVIRGREFEYTTVWQWSQILSVILWPLLGLSHIWWAFVYYHWYNNSIIDLISFAFTSLIFGQNLFFFVFAITNIESPSARGRFWYSTLLSATGPWLVWPIVLLANITHAILKKNTDPKY